MSHHYENEIHQSIAGISVSNQRFLTDIHMSEKDSFYYFALYFL